MRVPTHVYGNINRTVPWMTTTLNWHSSNKHRMHTCICAYKWGNTDTWRERIYVFTKYNWKKFSSAWLHLLQGFCSRRQHLEATAQSGYKPHKLHRALMHCSHPRKRLLQSTRAAFWSYFLHQVTQGWPGINTGSAQLLARKAGVEGFCCLESAVLFCLKVLISEKNWLPFHIMEKETSDPLVNLIWLS